MDHFLYWFCIEESIHMYSSDSKAIGNVILPLDHHNIEEAPRPALVIDATVKVPLFIDVCRRTYREGFSTTQVSLFLRDRWTPFLQRIRSRLEFANCGPRKRYKLLAA